MSAVTSAEGRSRALELTGSICGVVADLSVPRSAHTKARVHVGPCHELYAATSLTGHSKTSLGGPARPHRPRSPTFSGDTGSQPCFQASLNERVEALGSHGHLSLVNHPWSSLSSGFHSPGSVCFVAAGSLACGSQSQATRPHLPRCRLGLL